MRPLTHDEVVVLIDRHLVRIVNGLRGGASPSLVSGWIGVPLWLVWRIGHDARLLSPEEEQRYAEWLASTSRDQHAV